MTSRNLPSIRVITIFVYLFVAANLYADEKRVFCIQSYTKGIGCGSRIEEGMRRYLKTTSFHDKIIFDNFYIKSMRVNKTSNLIDKEVAKALQLIHERNPHIIVIFDDTACEKLIPKLLNTRYPVVFGGMNLPPEFYNSKFKFMNSRNRPGFNITGVTEEVDFIRALRVLQEIVPKSENMVIISSSGLGFITDVLENLKSKIDENGKVYPINLIATEYASTFKDFKNLILKYEKDKRIDVIFIFTLIALTDAGGEVVSVERALRWVADNQNKPGLSWMNDWVRLGHLCGVCVDLYRCGFQLGKMVEKVLDGEDPGNIPIEKPDHHFIALNKERAERLGIDIPIHVFEGAGIVYKKMEAFKN